MMMMMMFETSKHVPKTENRCWVFKHIYNTCAIKTICVFLFYLEQSGFEPWLGTLYCDTLHCTLYCDMLFSCTEPFFTQVYK